MTTSPTIDQDGQAVEETAIVPIESDGRVFGEIARALNLDREVVQPGTVTLAETTVLMLGASELERVREASLPGPKAGETMGEYIDRITPLLKPEELGKMQDMGLVAMLRLGKFSTLGLEFRLFGALKDGSWRHSPNANNDYRAWVRHLIIGEMEMSDATASRYSNGCLMLKWLYDNADEVGVKMPSQPEACFTGKFSIFSGVTRVLPKLGRAVRIANDENVDDADYYAALDDIKELVALIQNPDAGKTETETKGRAGSPRIEPIKFMVQPGSQMATYNIKAENISHEQLTKAQVALRDVAGWLIPGEADSELITVEYRRVVVPVCPQCDDGIVMYALLQDSYPQYGCPACGKFYGGEDDPDQSRYDMEKDVTQPDPLHTDEWWFRSDATQREWIRLEGDPRNNMSTDEFQVGTAQVDDLYGITVTRYIYRRKLDWMVEASL